MLDRYEIILGLSDGLQISTHCIYIMSCVELEGEVKTLTLSKSELQTSLDEWKVIEISNFFLRYFGNMSSGFSFCLPAFCSLTAFSIKLVLTDGKFPSTVILITNLRSERKLSCD